MSSLSSRAALAGPPPVGGSVTQSESYHYPLKKVTHFMWRNYSHLAGQSLPANLERAAIRRVLPTALNSRG